MNLLNEFIVLSKKTWHNYFKNLRGLSMYALLSVSDKTNIEYFAKELISLGYKILSTGGTLSLLKKEGIEALDIATYTNSEELFNGRVKTLHPKIHGGILFQRDNQDDCTMAKIKGIESIDLICVNLYPFKETINRTDDFDEIIENIDIGGPSMIRAGAKNFKSVLVVTHWSDYDKVIKTLRENTNTIDFRREMMIKAFNHTANYDCMIANYMNKRFCDGLGENIFISAKRAFTTRYGENPHQKGALYEFENQFTKNLKILKGEPSFNNLTDMNAAIKLASSFEDLPAVSIIKHGNPCGFAIKESALKSYEYALKCDPLSAYGGVVAINAPIDLDLAKKINETFIEVLIAPSISPEALSVFDSKKRIKIFSFGENGLLSLPRDSFDFKHIEGGIVYQDNDKVIDTEISNAEIMTTKVPTSSQMQDLKIAYIIAALTKSNCVSYVKDGMLVAIGMGMTSRIDASRAGITKAKDMGIDLNGCVLASEAFFPFKDSIEMAAEIGVSAIIEPGGSIRDDEVIACANKHNIALLFTHKRHFLH